MEHLALLDHTLLDVEALHGHLGLGNSGLPGGSSKFRAHILNDLSFNMFRAFSLNITIKRQKETF